MQYSCNLTGNRATIKAAYKKKSKKPQKNNILPHKKKERTNYKTKKFIHKF